LPTPKLKYPGSGVARCSAGWGLRIFGGVCARRGKACQNSPYLSAQAPENRETPAPKATPINSAFPARQDAPPFSAAKPLKMKGSRDRVLRTRGDYWPWKANNRRLPKREKPKHQNRGGDHE